MNSNQYSYIQNPQSIGQMPIPGGGVAPQVPMHPMSRRARMGQRLMSGVAMKLQALPNWFATFAVGTYAVALLGVNLMFSSYAMEWYFWLFGIGWVAGFFFLSVKFSQEWSISYIRNSKNFEKKLFWTGFWLRAMYAIFIYFFYITMTGRAYEFQAADSDGYVKLALEWSDFWNRDMLWGMLVSYTRTRFSDMGFPLAILLPVRWFGEEGALLALRIMFAFIGAYTAVVLYRLSDRSLGETTARISAIFCMLHPVLICYVGIILKEVLMTFLLVLFIDLGDRMLRSKKYSFATIIPMVIVGLSLFMFRTVLGMIAFMALFFALVMSDTRIVSWGKKVLLGVVLASILLMSASDNIVREVNEIVHNDAREQQERSLEYRYGEKKTGKNVGNMFAKYAGVAVFAPLIFTIPFPTMVVTQDQEDMRLIHGGNWTRNIMSGMVILAMFMLLFSGEWRKYTLPLAMMLGYLLMLAFTEFAHSLRFHIPVMPFEMMFAAYAIANMRKKHRNWYLIWCLFMVVACFAWNWFKLAGRGMA